MKICQKNACRKGCCDMTDYEIFNRSAFYGAVSGGFWSFNPVERKIVDLI